MLFRTSEKKRLIKLKPSLFSNAAQVPGIYRKVPYPFCLPKDKSEENIYGEFRDESLKYFSDRKIDWHDGNAYKPSNHLCCSQSACVNFLYPYRNKPEELKNVLSAMGYPVEKMLPLDADCIEGEGNSYVAFEWIGTKNYLKELYRGRVASDDNRSRGKGFTSADFAFLFLRKDNKRQLVLGEWKYTEEYRNKKSIQISKAGTDRLKDIYAPFLANNSPINISPYKDYSFLFYDPFDQLMRLQLLAKQMELSNTKEMGADIVTVLHIAPKANKELMEFIPKGELKYFGTNIHEVWSKIVEPGKFKGFSTEEFRRIVTAPSNCPDIKWGTYISTRYGF